MAYYEEYYGLERREHVRWGQIIPTKFSLLDEKAGVISKEMKDAYTQNISAGGVCIEVSHLDNEQKYNLVSGKIKILLEIHIAGFLEPILAAAKAVWISKPWKEKSEDSNEYLVGLKFSDITTSSKDKIVDFVLRIFIEQFKK